MDIEAMAAPYIAFGYRLGGNYAFPEKKLTAVHYRHPDPLLPKNVEGRLVECLLY